LRLALVLELEVGLEIGVELGTGLEWELGGFATTLLRHAAAS
jgi:hypothetical protein